MSDRNRYELPAALPACGRHKAAPPGEKHHTVGGPVLLTDVVLAEAIWTLAGKRYSLGKPELYKVIRMLIEDHSFAFEDSQVIWVALNDYENAQPVRGKTLDFADALILNRAKRFAEIRSMKFDGFYTFDQAQ